MRSLEVYVIGIRCVVGGESDLKIIVELDRFGVRHKVFWRPNLGKSDYIALADPMSPSVLLCSKAVGLGVRIRIGEASALLAIKIIKYTAALNIINSKYLLVAMDPGLMSSCDRECQSKD